MKTVSVKVGDVVQLITGGPHMVVQKTRTDHVIACWFDRNDDFRTIEVPYSALGHRCGCGTTSGHRLSSIGGDIFDTMPRDPAMALWGIEINWPWTGSSSICTTSVKKITYVSIQTLYQDAGDYNKYFFTYPGGDSHVHKHVATEHQPTAPGQWQTFLMAYIRDANKYVFRAFDKKYLSYNDIIDRVTAVDVASRNEMFELVPSGYGYAIKTFDNKWLSCCTDNGRVHAGREIGIFSTFPMHRTEYQETHTHCSKADPDTQVAEDDAS